MAKAITRLRSSLSKNIINIPGWRTKRKIVVIESDDWGSIRMPSLHVYTKFLAKGFDFSDSAYNRLDSLESNEDLKELYSVLSDYKDLYGNHPSITANFVVGNPDFEKIRNSDFTEYFFEPVTETLKRYPDRENVESLWRNGKSVGYFHPQFHSREHVNIVRWMSALRKKTPELMYTFDCETTFSGEGDYNFMEVLDYNTPEDLSIMNKSIVEGLDLFEKLFGYRSKSFIPPCYTWSSDIEKTLSENGVKYIQGLVIQSVPTGTFGKYQKKYHFLGHKNRFGQYYLVRNCFFEPSLTRTKDPVRECLNRIDIAFKWRKPAIISSHRVNFMGALDEKNRSINLANFNQLLRQILKLWPDVEFMTSDQLGDLICTAN